MDNRNTNFKRLCILQNGFIRGGSERFVINLCRGLQDIGGYDITVVNPATTPLLQVLEPQVLATGVRILHTHTLDSPIGKIKHFWRLYKILRHGRFDIFQCNIDFFNGINLLIAWIACVPIRCCHSHATMQERETLEGRTLKLRLYQGLMRRLCWHFANRHLGCSNEANDNLYKGHPWRKQPYPSVIFNGIDIEAYRTRRASSKGSSGSKKILFVGRTEPQKNPFFIIEIMKQLLSIRHDVQLLWVGEGSLIDKVKQRAQEFGPAVRFLGWRDDVADIMQQADLLLMPSFFEGLSVTFIEAQAANLPCLVSDATTPQAQCGLIKYLSLKEPATVWAQTASNILDGKENLHLDPNKINKFSIQNLTSQMVQAFTYQS